MDSVWSYNVTGLWRKYLKYTRIMYWHFDVMKIVLQHKIYELIMKMVPEYVADCTLIYKIKYKNKTTRDLQNFQYWTKTIYIRKKSHLIIKKTTMTISKLDNKKRIKVKGRTKFEWFLEPDVYKKGTTQVKRYLRCFFHKPITFDVSEPSLFPAPRRFTRENFIPLYWFLSSCSNFKRVVFFLTFRCFIADVRAASLFSNIFHSMNFSFFILFFLIWNGLH